MKKILVTGGAGYIGSHTVLELTKKGFEVIVLDDLRAGFAELLPPNVILEKVGLEDREKVFSVLEKHKPDAIIDFAAYLAVGESMKEPEKYFENNVVNFVNLLDAMVKNGCQFIVKSSTAAVYGNPQKKSDIPWQESYIDNYKPKESALLFGIFNGAQMSGERFLNQFLALYNKKYLNRPELNLTDDEIIKLRIPMSIYGVTKLIDEILLKKYNRLSGINYVAARYFNVCGADLNGKTGDSKPKPTNLMTLAIARVLGQIKTFQVYGDNFPTKDGTGVRDYIHPTDLAVGHLKAINYLFKGGKSEIINFATGEASTVLEVINAINNVSGQKVKYQVSDRRSGDPSISVANFSKAEQILGWNAKFRLKDMAKTAWEWESNNKMKILNNKKDEKKRNFN